MRSLLLQQFVSYKTTLFPKCSFFFWDGPRRLQWSLKICDHILPSRQPPALCFDSLLQAVAWKSGVGQAAVSISICLRTCGLSSFWYFPWLPTQQFFLPISIDCLPIPIGNGKKLQSYIVYVTLELFLLRTHSLLVLLTPELNFWLSPLSLKHKSQSYYKSRGDCYFPGKIPWPLFFSLNGSYFPKKFYRLCCVFRSCFSLGWDTCGTQIVLFVPLNKT